MTQEIPNCFYRISVKALILDEQKRFLLTLEDKGLWELPGGGLDFGEDPIDGLKREIKEEMGLEVVNIKSQPSYFITALQRNGACWIGNVIYEVQVRDLNFVPSAECRELRFFTKEDTSKEKLFPNVLEFLRIYNPNNHK